MLIRDLSKVWVSRNTPENVNGEYRPSWHYIGEGYFNIQQDINELDRKTSGETDYGIYKARAIKDYGIQTGDGISLTDISDSQLIAPEYRVIDITVIGSTRVIRMEKYNGG